MRALIQRGYGEPRDVLRVEPVDAAAVPASDEVRVRMEAAAVHMADLYAVAGREGFRRPIPRTPGYEGVGTVVAVGDRVQGIDVGARVFPPVGAGTLREFLDLPAERVMPAPAGDAAQLALLSVNPPTALLLLEDFVALTPGDWVMQNAANSNVGRCLITLARARGLRTVNVVRRESLMAELEALGGDLVLLDGPDLAGQVAEATGGAEIRLGVDSIGGAATGRLAACLAPGGTVVCCGSMSGQPAQVPFELLFRRDVRLRGFSMARQLERRSQSRHRRVVHELAAQVAEGTLRAKIAAIYTLDSAIEALEHAALSGAARDGKIVVALEA